ncbi:MAG: hypothetical protein R3330_00150 [Saprospiraceae bacterium]|nr:hypothetical protein [Saprospiraceae bacterium]
MSIACLIVMSGVGQTVLSQTFTVSNLSGEDLDSPTSLAFGPDQRLYVLQLNGTIIIYTVTRNAPNDYSVTVTDSTNLVRNIQNHHDDGTVNDTLERLATGMVVAGNPGNPVIYVTSSDYRQGGILGGSGDINLDTNSGVITRLTWNGSSWDRVDLVRGLPRSEENHATNGLFLDTDSNILYIASGGLTNAGSPSFAFAYLCEYALSSCILSVDLATIESMPVLTDTSSGASYIYDLPTLDDPTRANANGIDDPIAMGYDGVDLHDPFGGNDGLNQAKLVLGGPVQIHASGFRNAYDIAMTPNGMYVWDNGANQGWGGHPADEGYGTATNAYVVGEPGSNGPGPNDPQVNNLDGLHLITAAG